MSRRLVALFVGGILACRHGDAARDAADSAAPKAVSAADSSALRVVEAMGAAYPICSSRIGLLDAQMGLRAVQGATTQELLRKSDSISACPDSAARVVDGLYEVARRQSLSPRVEEMLKDAVAKWRANVIAFRPTAEEHGTIGSRRYSDRMQSLFQQWLEQRERMKMEMQ